MNGVNVELNRINITEKKTKVQEMGRNIIETQRRCREHALECSTKGEFKKKYPIEYRVSWEQCWLEEYVWLKRAKRKSKWTESACREEAKKYRTRLDFYKGSQQAYRHASKNGWLDTYTWFDAPMTWKKAS